MDEVVGGKGSREDVSGLLRPTFLGLLALSFLMSICNWFSVMEMWMGLWILVIVVICLVLVKINLLIHCVSFLLGLNRTLNLQIGYCGRWK